MKIVRKLLRLLPLIYLMFIFLIFIFNDGVFTLFTNGDIDSIGSFIEQFSIESGAWDYVQDTFLAFYGPLSPLNNWVYNNISNSYIIYGFVLPILCYELWCSLFFLMFDVFNFIIGVASNWLRKGESLNE